jgi:hypothetical protein
MNLKWGLGLASLALFVLAACDSDSSTGVKPLADPNVRNNGDLNGGLNSGASTARAACSFAARGICSDFVGHGLGAAQLKEACTQEGGESLGHCTSQGAEGHCLVKTNSQMQETWTFYDNIFTCEVAKQACAHAGGSFNCASEN